jgi:hypothetical protein
MLILNFTYPRLNTTALVGTDLVGGWVEFRRSDEGSNCCSCLEKNLCL